MDSILGSVKTVIGIPSDTTDFDQQLILHTNAILNIVYQEGLGKAGFKITGNSETWDDFLGDEKIDVEWVKGYVSLKVWLLFDLNSMTSGVIAAIKEQIHELEVRYYYEKENWKHEQGGN